MLSRYHTYVPYGYLQQNLAMQLNSAHLSPTMTLLTSISYIVCAVPLLGSSCLPWPRVHIYPSFKTQLKCHFIYKALSGRSCYSLLWVPRISYLCISYRNWHFLSHVVAFLYTRLISPIRLLNCWGQGPSLFFISFPKSKQALGKMRVGA